MEWAPVLCDIPSPCCARLRDVGKRMHEMEWDAIAGVIASTVALVLTLLNIVDSGVLVAVLLVIATLLLVRDLHREAADDRVETLLHGLAGFGVPVAGLCIRQWAQLVDAVEERARQAVRLSLV